MSNEQSYPALIEQFNKKSVLNNSRNAMIVFKKSTIAFITSVGMRF